MLKKEERRKKKEEGRKKKERKREKAEIENKPINYSRNVGLMKINNTAAHMVLKKRTIKKLLNELDQVIFLIN
jgi:hypothetical protein